MATTTPNFGWPVPTSTDLVKDGATAIEALGDGIDTSMVDLKGGTTGQILAKATNADMDFAWVTNDVGDITAVTAGTGISGGGTSGDVTITNSMATAIDAKGDLIPGTGADTFARLAVGANNTVLIADSAETTGMKWGGAWTTWTPTLTNITIGNGSVTARYQQIGKTVNFEFLLAMGSTTVMGGTPTISMPVTPKQYFKGFSCRVEDSGTAIYPGTADIFAGVFYPTVTVTSGSYGTIGYLSGTVPMTWAVNDTLSIMGTYEAA
jgi:hypothetical protein